VVDTNKKFKFLVQKKTGIVHMWNSALAQRTDMIDFFGSMEQANAFGEREKKEFGGIEVEEVVEAVEKEPEAVKEVEEIISGKIDSETEVSEEEETYKVKRKRKK